MGYIGKQPIVGNFQVCDAISVVNGQAAYTMQVNSTNVEPETAFHMLVSLNGILQKPGSSFTISGSTMTFASNLATGDVIDFVQILGNVLDIGQPSDDTVTAAKLATTSITGQTAETSAADADTILIHDDSASALRKMTRSNFLSGVGGDNTPAFYGELGSDSSSQSDGAYVKVTGMTTDEIDTDTAFDGTTFTVPSGEGGKYFIFGTVSMSSTGGSYTGEASEGHVYVNGSSVIKSRFRNHTTRDIGEDSQQVMGILDLSAGDTVELYGRFANDAFIFTTLDSGNAGTNFGGYKLIGI